MVGPRSLCDRFREARAMNDTSQFATALLALIFIGALLLVGIVMGFFINVNKFSLHATYRNRLIRAFLGASRARGAHWESGARRPR